MADFDIDITSDLDGSANEGALADNVSANQGIPQNGQQDHPAAPKGTVHVHDLPVTDKKEGEFNLRDQLSNAFKGEDAAAAAAAATNVPPADQQQQAPAKYEGPTLTQDAQGKWHTPDGAFATNEQVSAFEAATAAQANTADRDYTSVIAGMTPVEQEQFKALPAEIQQYVGRTMDTLNAQAAQYQEYSQLEQLIGPRRQAWAGNAMSPAMAVSQLLQLSDFASTNPKDFVLWFAQQNNVDLDAALDERDAAMQNVDPAVQELRGQVQQLTTMLQQQGQPQPQQQTEMVNQVNAFALEKDEGGNLKRPYLAQVKDTWPVHIQSLRAANPNMQPAEILQKAYDNACWANPAVRNSMQTEAQRAEQAAAAAATAKARAAGSSISGGPNGKGTSPQQQNSNLSLRDELAQQFAEARA